MVRKLGRCLGMAGALLLGQPAAAEPLELVTGPAYPPFAGEDLPQGGLAVAVLEAALGTQDRAVTVEVRPWQKAFKATAQGAVDGTFPYVRTAERAQEVRFSEPMFRVERVVISPASAPVTYNGAKEQLAGKRVCLPQGYAGQPVVRELIRAGRLADLNPDNARACLDLLKMGRAAFTVRNAYVWQALLARSGYTAAAFHVDRGALPPEALHVIVGKAHPDTQAILGTVNAGLAALRRSGRFDKLVADYLKDMR